MTIRQQMRGPHGAEAAPRQACNHFPGQTECDWCRAQLARTPPKPANMDGHSFEQWRFRVSQAISDLGREAYLDHETVAMFNCNYDPSVAAKEWLREHLAQPG